MAIVLTDDEEQKVNDSVQAGGHIFDFFQACVNNNKDEALRAARSFGVMLVVADREDF